MSKSVFKNLSLFELIVYLVAGALALWGLTYIALGLIGSYINVGADDNVLLKGSEALAKVFGLGFLGWGLIILSIGALLAVVCLCINAKKTDKEAEKAARRAARLGDEKVVGEINPAE